MHLFEIDRKSYRGNYKKTSLPSLDLIQWLNDQPLFPKVFWKEAHSPTTRASVGSLLSFPHVPHFATSSLSDMRLYGGIRFAKNNCDDKTWSEFPDTAFWLPQIEISQENGNTEMIQYFLNENPLENIWQQFNGSIYTTPNYSLIHRQDVPDAKRWRDSISRVLEWITKGDMSKVVLARKTTLQLSNPISAWSLLQELNATAQNATLFAFQLSPSLCFLGATPEKLFLREDTTTATLKLR